MIPKTYLFLILRGDIEADAKSQFDAKLKVFLILMPVIACLPKALRCLICLLVSQLEVRLCLFNLN